MKLMQNAASKLALCAFALSILTIASPLSAATSAQGAAKVIRKVGEARYSTGNGVWQKLQVGDVLKPGTLIQTASHSEVDLVLGESSEVARVASGVTL